MGGRTPWRYRMSHWGIIGDGQWGLALARRLVRNHHSVIMAGLNNMKRPPKDVVHTTRIAEVLNATERLIITVPIGELEAMLVDAGPHLRGDHRAVTTSRDSRPRVTYEAQRPSLSKRRYDNLQCWRGLRTQRRSRRPLQSLLWLARRFPHGHRKFKTR